MTKREPLLIIHGANGAASTMAPLCDALGDRVLLEVADWIGHGGRPMPDDYSIRAIVADLIDWMDGLGIARAFLCGYSIGGYVALCMAHWHPERIAGVVTLAAKFVFDLPAVDHITYLLAPERLARPDSTRPAELDRAHGPQDWRRITVANIKLIESLEAMPPITWHELRAIRMPVLIISGTIDQLVPAQETRAVAAALPNGSLMLFEGRAHPLDQAPLSEVATAIVRFMEG